MKVNWKTEADTSPILFSRRAQWTGITLRHFRIIAGEMPELKPANHEVNIGLAGNFTTLKRTASGGLRKISGAVDGSSFCLTQAGQPISAFWDDEIENLAIDITPSFLAQIAAENCFNPDFEFVEKAEMKDALIQHVGLALLAEAHSETPSGRLYADSLIQTLTLHLLTNYSTADSRRINLNGGLSGYKLRRVSEFINENLEADLSLAEIAEVADLSQFHFARAFRKSTGQTPQQYLMRQRIERAKELLARGDLPIVEISLRTGFKNQSHFTTLFRKFTKLTPKIWRESKLA